MKNRKDNKRRTVFCIETSLEYATIVSNLLTKDVKDLEANNLLVAISHLHKRLRSNSLAISNLLQSDRMIENQTPYAILMRAMILDILLLLHLATKVDGSTYVWLGEISGTELQKELDCILDTQVAILKKDTKQWVGFEFDGDEAVERWFLDLESKLQVAPAAESKRYGASQYFNSIKNLDNTNPNFIDLKKLKTYYDVYSKLDHFGSLSIALTNNKTWIDFLDEIEHVFRYVMFGYLIIGFVFMQKECLKESYLRLIGEIDLIRKKCSTLH